jgi:Type IV secretion-system coupling protein DNA-binding domain
MNDPSFLPLGTRIGWYERREPFGIRQVDRRSHMWIIGGSGTGKTRFIQQQIQEDIRAGRGVGLIDPHGDLAQDIIAAVPPERVNDVVLMDLSDTEWPVALNVLQGAPTPDAVAASLVGAFKDYFEESWGPRLEWCLYNSLGLLSSVRDTSLLYMQRAILHHFCRARTWKRCIQAPLNECGEKK